MPGLRAQGLLTFIWGYTNTSLLKGRRSSGVPLITTQKVRAILLSVPSQNDVWTDGFFVGSGKNGRLHPATVHVHRPG